MLKKRVAFLTSFLTIVSYGCTMIEDREKSNALIDEHFKFSQEMVAQGQVPLERPFLEVVDEIYVDTIPIKISDRKLSLRAAFSDTVSISSGDEMNIYKLSEIITRLTGISAVVEQPGGGGSGSNEDGDSFMSPSDGSLSAAQPTASLDSTSIQPTESSSGGSSNFQGNNFGGTGFGGAKEMPLAYAGRTMKVRFSGNLEDLLERVTAELNLFWRYDNEENRIVFHQYDTEVFTLASLPDTTEINVSVTNEESLTQQANSSSGSSSGSSGTATSAQTTISKSELDLWDETLSAIKSILSSDGTVSINKSIGTIAVTDTPLTLNKVRRYINKTNEAISKQVTIKVDVYNVEIDNDHQLGLDWELIWETAKHSATIVSPASPIAVAAGELSAQVLSNSSDFRGSQAMIRAISSQGRISLKNSTTVVTMNNQPVPVKIADETTYLKEATQGQLSSAVTSTTLTTELIPGKVITGFSMHLLPRVLDANQLMIQYSINMSTLNEIKKIESGTLSIEAPNVTTRNFMQKSSLKSGQTLVLTGFSSDENRVNDTTFLSSPNGMRNSRNRNVTLIMITPYVSSGFSIDN
ncbi:PilN family type IVB pilus formation outer membrane protein (plasmid) [Methylomarinum sp. Ch1-1]|uniref:PilN family type IVB pilus formation outer membrane protein n=1 Tax=Methylomarinum roseum TaxID=3067653 RepID=A0AAU7P0T4_9GAMM|nr:PilN family type IVB pilus formation outer membrane protein [Methylomarinum sp. Ch1-1]MDP4523204.1 PilN family type IVB pilus formation outer membrane protein [Methylomarinum sp. Ch1-1]